jgi:hypothetical protein
VFLNDSAVLKLPSRLVVDSAKANGVLKYLRREPTKLDKLFKHLWKGTIVRHADRIACYPGNKPFKERSEYLRTFEIAGQAG